MDLRTIPDAGAAGRGRERFSDAKRRERQDLILDEATRALAEQGCCRVRVEDVAARAGVGKGTIYLDFGSKEELISGALRRAGRALIRRVSERVDARSSPAERLEEGFRALIEIAKERPEPFRLLERHVPCDHSMEGSEQGPERAVETYLRDLLAKAQDAGAIEPAADPELVARASVAVVSSPAWRKTLDAHGVDGALRSLEATLPISLARSGT